MEYLRGVRLRHAFALLRHTEMTLDSVSDRCGFHSASHLSRHVKAATGATPGSIRLASMRQKQTKREMDLVREDILDVSPQCRPSRSLAR